MINTQEKNNGLDLIAYSNWALIKDVGRFVKPYKGRFIFASLSRFVSDIIGLYPSYGFALIVTFFSNYSPGDSLRYFWIIIIILTAAYFFKYIFRFSAKQVGYQVAEKVALDAQTKTISHLFRLDIAWHERENSGNKLKRIQKGSDGLNRILRMWISNFIEIGINLVGMIFILGKFDLKVGMVMVLFVLTYFFISFYLLTKASAVSQEVDILEEGVLGLMFQSLNNIRSVKMLDMSERILKKIKHQIGGLFQKILKRITRFQTRGGILNLWTTLFRVGAIIIIAYGIIDRKYEVGFLVLFVGYFNSLVDAVEELSETTQDLTVSKYGIARMQRTVNEPILIDNESGKVDCPKDWRKIKVINLSFAYGKRKILKNISFEINRGERIGIIGLSGAGKSTLMKLLMKENENYEGEILIDDLSIKKIKRRSYFEKLGVVLQDTEVFNFSLRENIILSSPKDFGEKALNEALSISYVSDFLSRLPQGVETFIGEKGIRLSGGERQRLGIARAIYKKPEILLLDEATSHLDLESEEKIKDSLHKFFQKVTAVVIAHRLTTIRQMDKILVIEKGEVVESGSFDELYNAKGRLFELWEKQKF
ncbi:MAG: ABC transporter ATP-binding protein [Parcubacteria group bacterium]|jgi:ABC-type multidrug transport system fused ATPase/permease subunit